MKKWIFCTKTTYLKILKAKDQFQLGSQAMIHHLAILSLTGTCKGLREANQTHPIIRKYRKLHLRACFARLSQIQLQPFFTYRKRVNCFEVTAGSCRSLLRSEWKLKDNLLTESYSYKEQKLSQCTGKQNYVMKNEKELWLLLLEHQKNDPE